MCGILLEVYALDTDTKTCIIETSQDNPSSSSVPSPDESSQQSNPNLRSRGPDHLGSVELNISNQEDGCHHRVQLKASVLKMRHNSTLQPVSLLPDDSSTRNESSNKKGGVGMHLAWNGEVYQRWKSSSSRMETVAGYEIDDTQLVAEMLLQVYQENKEMGLESGENNDTFLQNYARAVANVMGQMVNAEYAFCLVTPWAVYYGRDPHGRRSLLYWEDNSTDSDDDGHTQEASNDDNSKPAPKPLLSSGPHSWKIASVAEHEMACNIENNNMHKWDEIVPGIVFEYRFVSGETHTTPIQLPLDMPTTPVDYSLLQQQHQVALPSSSLEATKPDSVTDSMWKASLAFEHYLLQAVRLRVCGSGGMEEESVTYDASSSHNDIAVLFSGGIDSVVLTAVTLQVLPTNQPLCLWNVSFVDQHTHNDDTNKATAKAQDCLAAQASFEELKRLFPHHTMHLETTEVSWDEMAQWESHVRTLLHPKTTTMDLNIAMALWYASRGHSRGQANNNDDNGTTPGDACDPEKKDPIILLVGMGADEQLGGYGRHRKAYEHGIKENASLANHRLRQELDMDIERLWERNLGRDDRIFSDHGKEARFPYLDYHVVKFLAQTPLEDTCDFSLPPGQGDKMILRIMAARLGLQTASGMVKRAIQFGSRISHVSDKRRFGSRRKAKGTAVV